MSLETPEVYDVASLRKARGWSQVQMADFLGVNQSTVSRMENGEAPSGPVLRLLAMLAEGNVEPAGDA